MMDQVLVVGLATGCLITAVEGLLILLGKFRGLVALIASLAGFWVITGLHPKTIFEVLAATFVGLTASMVVEQSFTGISSREIKGLPKRIPPR